MILYLIRHGKDDDNIRGGWSRHSLSNESKTKKSPNQKDGGLTCRHRSIFPGSHPPSIFDTDELNFCVRNGNRWILIASNTDFTLN